MSDERFRAAVAGEVLAGAEARQELLQSIVDVARAIFLAQAASIAILDAGETVFRFEAVSGAGGDALLGVTFPAGQGIAGLVAQTGEPTIVDDLTNDPRFARDLASRTGYIPTAMMVAPLLRGDRTLGTLSVLDRGRTGRSTLEELELLVTFADQAALAVDLGEAARRAAGVLEGGGSEVVAVARLAGAVSALDDARRPLASRLIADLAALLET